MTSLAASPIDIARLYQEFRLRRRNQRHREQSAVRVAVTATVSNAEEEDKDSAGSLVISSSAVAIGRSPAIVEDAHSLEMNNKEQQQLKASESVGDLGVNNACGNNNVTTEHGNLLLTDAQRKLASLVVLDPKDIKRILKQAAVSGMFDMLSRHESRMHARERWLLKRLKKTLGKFELAAASAMARSVEEERRQKRRQDCNASKLDEEPSLKRDLAGCSAGEFKVSRQQHGHRVADGADRPRRSLGAGASAAGTSLETATCLRVPDSETACGVAHQRSSSNIFGPHPQLVSSQSNCNNSSSHKGRHRILIGRDQLQHLRAAREDDQATTVSCSSSCGVSTRTSCSVDSLSESSLEPAYSGFNIASAPPTFFEKQKNKNNKKKHQNYQQLEDKKVNNANCNHSTGYQSSTPGQLIYAGNNSEGSYNNWQSMQSQQQQQQQQQQYQQQQQPQRRQQQLSRPQPRGIYSPARPDKTSVHQGGPGVCPSCQAAAVTSEDRPQPQQKQQRRNPYQQKQQQCSQPQQNQQKCPPVQKQPQCPPRKRQRQKQQRDDQSQKQPPPRCTRCPAPPGLCPRRLRSASRNKKLLARQKKRQQKACVTEEATCGDCKPPRIVLCPAPRRGRSNYSRLKLQTQPGRFITRQVLFFDGSHLFKPVQPKGPCY